MRQFRPTSDGFTMLELMVIVAVIGIVSAILIPFSTRAYADQQLRTAAIALSAHLRSARQAALAGDAACTVTITAAGAVTSAGSCAGRVPPINISLETRLNNFTVGGDLTVVFNRVGVTPAQTTTVLTSNQAQNEFCVGVSTPLGIVRTGVRPAGGGCTYGRI